MLGGLDQNHMLPAHMGRYVLIIPLRTLEVLYAFICCVFSPLFLCTSNNVHRLELLCYDVSIIFRLHIKSPTTMLLIVTDQRDPYDKV